MEKIKVTTEVLFDRDKVKAYLINTASVGMTEEAAAKIEDEHLVETAMKVLLYNMYEKG